MKDADVGRRTPNYERLKRQLKAQRRPCWNCGQPIDYNARWPDGESFSVEHIQPKSTHPHLAEEPTNLAASHLRCNQTRGTNDQPPELGSTSREW